MRFASVCSGIEAASLAWLPLGWECAWLSEIDPFACAVLAHHYPNTPNHGDMTEITDEQIAAGGPIDVLVGGTPCQSFSVAGLRGGLDDDRGNLALEFLRLAARTRAEWVVWENVPGVLSSNRGRDFGALLGGLAELGYGFAYRVLDAQFFGVAQRRRRVFLVGCPGGQWQRAAAVLVERQGLSGDPPPRREAGSRVAALTAAGVGTCGADDNQAQAGHLIAHNGSWGKENGGHVARPLNAPRQGSGGGYRADLETDTLIAAPIAFDTTQITSSLNRSNPKPGDPCHPVTAGGHPPAIAFHTTQDPISDPERSPALGATPGSMAVTFPIQDGRAIEKDQNGIGIGDADDPAYTVDTTGAQAVGSDWGVRRLTPRECERLQGFPDDYTLVPYTHGKPAKDGPRYKAIGNSIAVPVLRWIGERLERVETRP